MVTLISLSYRAWSVCARSRAVSVPKRVSSDLAASRFFPDYDSWSTIPFHFFNTSNRLANGMGCGLMEIARDGSRESERRQAYQYLESYARSGLTIRIGEEVRGESADTDLAALRAIFQSSGVYSDSGGEVLELEAVREDEDGNETPLREVPPGGGAT
jgi:hypothetical protein